MTDIRIEKMIRLARKTVVAWEALEEFDITGWVNTDIALRHSAARCNFDRGANMTTLKSYSHGVQNQQFVHWTVPVAHHTDRPELFDHTRKRESAVLNVEAVIWILEYFPQIKDYVVIDEFMTHDDEDHIAYVVEWGYAVTFLADNLDIRAPYYADTEANESGAKSINFVAKIVAYRFASYNGGHRACVLAGLAVLLRDENWPSQSTTDAPSQTEYANAVVAACEAHRIKCTTPGNLRNLLSKPLRNVNSEANRAKIKAEWVALNQPPSPP